LLQLAKGEEEERKRRMEEDKELSDQRAKLYDQVISVQEELLQQFRIKLANLEMKHEQQRQVAIDTKVKMQEELLTEINKKEVKKAVAEEQARQSEELSPEEIQRRVDISNHLTSVHKELLSKRSQVKVRMMLLVSFAHLCVSVRVWVLWNPITTNHRGHGGFFTISEIH
jgi:(p)ppGpp synthase/HD superfamily hydrolase